MGKYTENKKLWCEGTVQAKIPQGLQRGDLSQRDNGQKIKDKEDRE